MWNFRYTTVPHPAALSQQGDALRNLGRLPEALAAYDAALSAAPQDAVIHCKRGLALKDLGRLPEALASLERGIELQPQLAPAHMDRANVLQDLGRLPDALAAYDRAVASAPRYPDAWCNRGTALHRLGRLADAIASYDAALAIDPRHAAADLNRSTTLSDLGRHQEALAGFERAVSRDPDNALAHWNEALCRLRMGDFERGWPKFEWRWRYAELGLAERHYPQPRWLGDTGLAGCTILVHAEQGLGDALQFCRYAEALAARGASVILQVPTALRALLASLRGVQRVLGEGEPAPAFDCHAPMLGLPRAFGTTLASIPANVPYLNAEPQRIARWAKRLGTRTGRPRVGLAWSGNPRHTNDTCRSIPLHRFGALTALEVDFVALQPDIRESDRLDLDAARIRFFGTELQDFADTAALAVNLDLVISVDTSIAHLAGALGLPVWILLPFAPDWRWLRDRADSPWYPTARLFRQSEPGDWDGVIARARRELQAAAPAA